MWRKIQDPNSKPEPIELLYLKQLLHNNRCKCRICVYKKKSFLNENKEIQVKEKDSNIFCLANSDLKLRETRSSNVLNSIRFCRNTICPGCFMALNLHSKYCKDETSETNPYMFSCDKSTDKLICYSEKSTSAINEVLPVFNQILYSLSDEPSSDDALLSGSGNEKIKKDVGFIEHQKHPQIQSIRGDCLCIENFINSIRPPL